MKLNKAQEKLFDEKFRANKRSPIIAYGWSSETYKGIKQHLAEELAIEYRKGYDEALKAENLMPAFQEDKRKALSTQKKDLIKEYDKVFKEARSIFKGEDHIFVLDALDQAISVIKKI